MGKPDQPAQTIAALTAYRRDLSNRPSWLAQYFREGDLRLGKKSNQPAISSVGTGDHKLDLLASPDAARRCHERRQLLGEGTAKQMTERLGSEANNNLSFFKSDVFDQQCDQASTVIAVGQLDGRLSCIGQGSLECCGIVRCNHSPNRAAVLQPGRQAGNGRHLQIMRRDPPGRWLAVTKVQGVSDVVAVSPALLDGMAGGHPSAKTVADDASKKAGLAKVAS